MVYYRRQETITGPVPAFEKVTINRKDKTMTAEGLFPNTDGTTAVIDRHNFATVGTGVKDEFEIFACVVKSF